MHETTADVRRDIAETRARVSQTLAELDTEIGSRREAVRDRLVSVKAQVTDPVARAQDSISAFIQEHPWVALGVAVAAGVLVSSTGADAAAASGAANATRAAGRGISEAARGLVHRDGSSETVASGAGSHSFSHDPATGAIGSSSEDLGQPTDGGGVFYRLSSGLIEAVGGDQLLAEMRREAEKFARGV